MNSPQRSVSNSFLDYLHYQVWTQMKIEYFYNKQGRPMGHLKVNRTPGKIFGLNHIILKQFSSSEIQDNFNWNAKLTMRGPFIQLFAMLIRNQFKETTIVESVWRDARKMPVEIVDVEWREQMSQERIMTFHRKRKHWRSMQQCDITPLSDVHCVRCRLLI